MKKKLIKWIIFIGLDMALLAYLLFIGFLFNNGCIKQIEIVEKKEEAINQEDLNKLDFADYKMFDYLEQADDASKTVVYYNTKVCKVSVDFSTENISFDRINEFIDYSYYYFYEKFGIDLYQGQDLFGGYFYMYTHSLKYDIVETDTVYGASFLFPTERRVALTNMPMNFQFAIKYHKNSNWINIELAYKTLNERYD